jgi:hypothetical protein
VRLRVILGSTEPDTTEGGRSASSATAALGGVALGQRGENRRATKRDQQGLRDAKADRLRRLYEPFVEFALALRQVAYEKGYVLEGDTVEERDARHQQMLSDVMKKVSAVAAAAIVEPGTSTVRDTYQRTYRACDRYLRSLNMSARVPNTVSLDQLNEEFDAITTAADELEAVVLRQMEDLEKPV